MSESHTCLILFSPLLKVGRFPILGTQGAKDPCKQGTGLIAMCPTRIHAIVFDPQCVLGCHSAQRCSYISNSKEVSERSCSCSGEQRTRKSLMWPLSEGVGEQMWPYPPPACIRDLPPPTRASSWTVILALSTGYSSLTHHAIFNTHI